MSEEITVPMTHAALPGVRPAEGTGTWLRTGGIVLAGSVFVAVCAHVVLPLSFTPVPLTLQTFAVVVLGLMLSPRLAAGTLLAYLAEGAVGLPVFSPAPMIGGLAHLLGPTGGYLLAYPAAAGLISILVRRAGLSRWVGGYGGAVASAAAGSLLILACGGLCLRH